MLIIEFLWIKFRLKSFSSCTCILMVLCVYASTDCIQKARFKPMHVIKAKLCRHLVFQMSFRNIQGQKRYRNFWGDRAELWPSIYFHSSLLTQVIFDHGSHL